MSRFGYFALTILFSYCYLHFLLLLEDFKMLECMHLDHLHFCLLFQFRLSTDCFDFKDIGFASQIDFKISLKFLFAQPALLFLS